MSNTKQFWQDLKLELLMDNLAVESPTPTLPATDSQLAEAGLGTSELYDQEPNSLSSICHVLVQRSLCYRVRDAVH